MQPLPNDLVARALCDTDLLADIKPTDTIEDIQYHVAGAAEEAASAWEDEAGMPRHHVSEELLASAKEVLIVRAVAAVTKREAALNDAVTAAIADGVVQVAQPYFYRSV